MIERTYCSLEELEKTYNLLVKSYGDLRNKSSSSVVNTLTTDCSLRWGSLDQMSAASLMANAKYGVSSGSEISDLALFFCCGDIECDKSTILDNIDLILGNLSWDIFSFEQNSRECSFNSSRIKGWEYNSSLCFLARFNVNEPFLNSEKAIFASTTSLIQPPNLFLTRLANLSQSSSVIVLSFVNSSSSSNNSILSSCLSASSLATSDQFIHENLSIFALRSFETVSETDTIYASPLFLLNSSNSSNSLTLFSNALLNIAGHATSGCLSNLSFKSFGNDIVIVGIDDHLAYILYSVQIQDSVQIFKPSDFEHETLYNIEVKP